MHSVDLHAARSRAALPLEAKTDTFHSDRDDLPTSTHLHTSKMQNKVGKTQLSHCDSSAGGRRRRFFCAGEGPAFGDFSGDRSGRGLCRLPGSSAPAEQFFKNCESTGFDSTPAFAPRLQATVNLVLSRTCLGSSCDLSKARNRNQGQRLPLNAQRSGVVVSRKCPPKELPLSSRSAFVFRNHLKSILPTLDNFKRLGSPNFKSVQAACPLGGRGILPGPSRCKARELWPWRLGALPGKKAARILLGVKMCSAPLRKRSLFKRLLLCRGRWSSCMSAKFGKQATVNGESAKLPQRKRLPAALRHVAAKSAFGCLAHVWSS